MQSSRWQRRFSTALGDLLTLQFGPDSQTLVAFSGGSAVQLWDTAGRQLAAMEELAQPALKETLEGKPSAEQRRRIEGLLEPTLLVRSPEKRRQL